MIRDTRETAVAEALPYSVGRVTNTSLPDTQCNIADDCLALSWSNLSSFATALMHVLIAILGFCMEMTLAGDTMAFLQSDCVAMWVAAGTT